MRTGRFFPIFLQLMRIPNSFTAMSNILAAQLLITRGELQWPPLIFLLAASACLYTGGIILNDCFDLDEDRRERPSRPLPSGKIPVTTAWMLGFLFLAAGVVLAGLVSPGSMIVSVIIVALVLLYDGYAKHTAAGSLVMGLCRYGNWLLGLSTAGHPEDSWLLALPILFYVTSLTILSKAETTAEKRTPLLLCTGGITLTAILILGLNLTGHLPHTWALVLLAAAFLFISRRLYETSRSFSPQQVQLTVKTLVLGIIPLDAILVFAGGPWWGGLAVLSLLVPGALLARIMYVT